MAEVQRFEDRGEDLIVWVIETDNPAFDGMIGMAIDGAAMPSEHLVAEGLRPQYRGIVYLCEKSVGRIPQPEAAAIIDHEIGHIVLGHLTKGNPAREDGVLLVEEFEIEADAYAASIHGAGTVSRMLRYAMLETCRKKCDGGEFLLSYAKKEMRKFLKDPIIASRLAALAA